jgi:sulfite exporter TauE/SafE
MHNAHPNPMLTAFLIGLLSAIHCIGMCGGIAGALGLSLAPDIRTRGGRLALYSLAYNLGRISSYMLAGLLAGWAGAALIQSLDPAHGWSMLRAVAGVILILLGLYLGGWFPRLAMIERIGTPLWRRLQPLGQRLLPVDNPGQAYLFGMIWGWLPCGLVYYALLLAIAQGSAGGGALYMLAFGLGTLLPMLTVSQFTGRLNDWRKSPIIRRASGALLVLMGLVSLWLLYNPATLHSLHFIPGQEQATHEHGQH